MTRLLLAACLCLAAGQARAAEVTLTVNGVRASPGHILAGLCPRADFLRPDCPYRAKAPVSAGTVVLHFTGVPPGTFAAEAFQDANDNGRLDKNFFGVPREPVAFSNDAPMHFGPPSFDKAAFEVRAPVTAISVTMRYR